MRLLIMGPPGAGKGTQAVLIGEHYGIPAISTGDIFRAMKTAETPLADQLRAIMDSGGYVSDDITNAIVADRLAQPDCADGFLLDGYPRTVAQVETLDAALAASGTSLDAVVSLVADVEEVVPGCSSGPRSRAGPTTTRTPSGCGCRCTPSRPLRCSRSTGPGAAGRGGWARPDRGGVRAHLRRPRCAGPHHPQGLTCACGVRAR